MTHYFPGEDSNIGIVDPFEPSPIYRHEPDPIWENRGLVCNRRSKSPLEIQELAAKSYIKDQIRMKTIKAVRQILEETLEDIEPPDGVRPREYRKNVLSRLPLMKNLYDIVC